MILRRVIPMVVSRREPLLRIFQKIGIAQFAV
jgi:hypothetical protein